MPEAGRSVIVVVLFLLAHSLAVGGEAPSATRAWAENLHLMALGGPAPGDLEVLVNGEFAVELGASPGGSIPVGDMLVVGINTLELRMREPEEPRGRTARLQIQVAPMVETSAYHRESGKPLVAVDVPEKLRGAGADCVQPVSFWAGPPPQRDVEPADRHWLLMQGAPSTHWFTVSVNGVPVYSGSSGDTFFEISDFVIVGRNEVLYSASPTCLSPPTGRNESFEFSISTGEVEVDTVRFGQPMAMLAFAPDVKKPAFEKSRAFRGR